MNKDYTFKLGSTSLTYPNLNLLENVERTSTEFDLVELTLEYPRNLPLKDRTIRKLKELGQEMELDYSIHLPLSVKLATTNPRLREASVEVVAETYKQAEKLDPLVYTLHLSPIYYPGGSPLTHLFEIEQYMNQLEKARESLGQLKDYLNPGKIAVENLFTDLHRLQGFIDESGYGRCLDVGHLVKRGKDPALHFYENSDSIINVHLHGVVEGSDHQQLGTDGDGLNLVGLFEVMKERSYDGPVILEQFKPEHLEQSLDTIDSAWSEVEIGKK